MLQLKPGFVFKDPKTDFIWKISHPWINRWTKKQMGWICKKVGTNLEQYPVSRWSQREIINLLNQVEPTKPALKQNKGLKDMPRFLQGLRLIINTRRTSK